MTTTDTPRTDACPYCGAERPPKDSLSDYPYTWVCGTSLHPDNSTSRSELCEARDAYRKAEKALEGRLKDLDDLHREREKSKRLQAEFERLKALMHQTIWVVEDMIKTHTNGCEHCLKKQGAMIALFKDITEGPQWPIDPTNK